MTRSAGFVVGRGFRTAPRAYPAGRGQNLTFDLQRPVPPSVCALKMEIGPAAQFATAPNRQQPKCPSLRT